MKCMDAQTANLQEMDLDNLNIFELKIFFIRFINQYEKLTILSNEHDRKSYTINKIYK